MTKGEAEDLERLQSEWGRGHLVETLAAMYGKLREAASPYVKEDDHAHEAAAKIIQRYIGADGFHIRNFPVYLARTARNLEADRHRRKVAQASPETFDHLPDCRDYRETEYTLEEAATDLGQDSHGEEAILIIRRARSKREAIAGIEASGASREWIRCQARAIFVLWRGYHAKN